jgi:hypothetical protein
MMMSYYVYAGNAPFTFAANMLPPPSMLLVTVFLMLTASNNFFLAGPGNEYYTDEALHTYYSERLSAGITGMTGSPLIGEWGARSMGYLKETVDVLVGKPWSTADLEANETGIAMAK